MGPDILAGISYLQDAMLLTKQMKQYNLAPKVFYCVGPGWTSPEYIADRGKDINGFFVSWAPACIDPRALTNEGKELHRQLLSRYRKKFGEEPVDFSGYTFAGCYILFNEVLPRAASLDPDKIREAIFKVDKPIGSYPNGWGAKFDETGQNTRCFPVDSQYQDMEPVFLCPEAIASGKPIMVPLPPWKARN
jgi:branched-chain amino acid transport system substrate-binding protein